MSEQMQNLNMYVVYGTPTCPFCVKAVDLLKERKLSFVYINIRESDAHRESLRLAFERMGKGYPPYVPQIFKGDKYIGGYAELESLI